MLINLHSADMSPTFMQEEVTVVGRIVHDAESSSGSVKLNEASLVLESSRMMGSGARVPLRFDADVKVRRGVRNGGGQGMFPGAIVALKGKNGGGGSFYVTEILSVSLGRIKFITRFTTPSMRSCHLWSLPLEFK